jgi:hypothetical protein
MKLEIIIEVKSGAVSEKTVRGKDGREYLIREQGGWVDLGKPYPQEVRISLERGQEGYAAGQYLMDESCLYVDRYGKLSLGRLKLIPLNAKLKI